ncbi:transmembrane protein 156 isoform X4 [Dipodomys spectabilis]|uniref:transmembrane protein 156 isoform X4 n=1 Tax=Dipodomys spectabilis TaxID=105255 RepID=UPI001C543A3C|nr:transmembrane protein 156 isoform X4 [Dipodomys spectabilis]
MPQTVLLKLFVAVAITFILILPEYFKTPQGLITKGSMAVKDNDFYAPCEYFNVTLTPIVDNLEEYNTSCNLKTHTKTATIMEKEPAQEESLNHTCRTVEYADNCIHIYLHLEMDVKNVTCAMKITWYILVLLVFILLILFITYKVLEGHRTGRKWQSDNCKSMAGLFGGGNSEKRRALTAWVIPAESTQGLSLAGVKEILPPIPELEATSSVDQEDLHT